jgi:hypothetical protein
MWGEEKINLRQNRSPESLQGVQAIGSISNFSKLIPAKAFEKIEKILDTASPLQGFRESLTKFLWHFYLNSLPDVEIKVSHKVFVKTLRKAAARAEELADLTEQLFASANAIVFRELGEFGRAGFDWQSSHPWHRSGVPLVGVLSPFALKTRRLAEAPRSWRAT